MGWIFIYSKSSCMLFQHTFQMVVMVVGSQRIESIGYITAIKGIGTERFGRVVYRDKVIDIVVDFCQRWPSGKHSFRIQSKQICGKHLLR